VNLVCNGLPSDYAPKPLLHAGACEGIDASPGPHACVHDSDCANGEACGYRIADGCAATGQCFPRGPVCDGFSPGCDCAGQTVDIICNGLPDGYAPEPIQYEGACVAVDAGGG
jgi:hypothetical protein